MAGGREAVAGGLVRVGARVGARSAVGAVTTSGATSAAVAVTAAAAVAGRPGGVITGGAGRGRRLFDCLRVVTRSAMKGGARGSMRQAAAGPRRL